MGRGRGRGKNGGKGTGNKKHNQYVQNRLGDVKNSIGRGEAKELICTIHERELRGAGSGECWLELGCRGIKGRKKMRQL